MEKPIVMLAEPHAALRRQVQSLLLKHGFAVIEAPDETTVLRALRQKLLKHGFAVIEAPDETTVLRALRQKRRLDLLIVNASLKARNAGKAGKASIDGLDVARKIRSWNELLPNHCACSQRL